jgi:hypothetical protein
MHMEWLKRIRLGLKPLKTPKEGSDSKGSMYQLAKAANIGVTSYKNIENSAIGPRERLLIAAWRKSGKNAEVLLSEIESELSEEQEKKLSNSLKALKGLNKNK